MREHENWLLSNQEEDSIFSNKELLNCLDPLLENFVKEQSGQFAKWYGWASQQYSLLEERKSLEKEKNELSFLYKNFSCLTDNLITFQITQNIDEKEALLYPIGFKEIAYIHQFFFRL
uniref:Uncharacterized protein n=1 Tax=Cyphia crenata TaxID=2041116 RepID=A0A291F3F8_9ASTR|nr:hypothetical protein Cyp_cre1Pt0003 [Cyphia crenata]ATG26674.1 hypothetical protein Cyp_cre1Pt0003 [Cyphia crenata]